MMKRGIMVFDHPNDRWRIWIGQRPIDVEQGNLIQLRIKNQYYLALVEKDFDWFISLDEDLSFNLRSYEVYKVKIQPSNFEFSNAPF
jgi:hypothetical protein